MNAKFKLIKCEELIDAEDFHEGIMVDFDELNDSDKEELIGMVEFKINKNAKSFDEENKHCWKLVDLQGGNLGNIEDDEFEIGDYDGIIERLDVYWQDYGIYFKYELDNYNYQIISY